MDGTRTRLTAHERFWKKVDRSGGPDACWPWTGFTRPKGYGQFHVDQRRGITPAHVVAREFATGEVCPPGKEGCHTCDNPPCCNPRHVYYGTRRENVDDTIERGHVLRGEQRHNARLTAGDVIRIRERCAQGEAPVDLADEYGVSPMNIRLIERGQRWKHIGGPIREDRARRDRKVA